jgi:hypothetical protein
MSHRERHGLVTDDRAADERLKTAFHALGAGNGRECSSDDLDRVWRAMDGTLGADERRELIDRLASDPDLAEAWRVARELHAASEAHAPARTAPRRAVTGWRSGWLAAAAVLLAAIGSVVVFQRIQPADDTFRAGDSYSVESLIDAAAALPRDQFRLRWTPGPPDTRYQVRVTTEDLQVLTVAADLPAAEVVVARDSLSPVASGGRVLWQVTARLSGGRTITSATFVTRVQ